nr:hypothetical protein [Tanacetum cinerariifolium]
PKGGGSGRGVKEKSGVVPFAKAIKYTVMVSLSSMKEPMDATVNTSPGIGVSTNSKDTMNDNTPGGVTSAIQEGVTPSVVDMMVEMRKQTSLDDTNVLESFPSLSTLVTTMPSNALGKFSYANITGKPSGKKVNVRTLFTPEGNGIDVINNPFILKKWHPNENLLKKDVTTVPVWVKLHGVLVTAFSEDGLSAIATKLGASEKKTVKKPSQTSRGVSVGLKWVLNLRENIDLFPKSLLATSSGSSFMNVDDSSSGNTPIIDKIEKFEDLLTSGQAILVDKAGNPLKKVEFMGEYDSEDEVASIDNDMARSMASERDLSHKLQAICDNLDIRVRGRKK